LFAVRLVEHFLSLTVVFEFQNLRPVINCNRGSFWGYILYNFTFTPSDLVVFVVCTGGFGCRDATGWSVTIHLD
jgi:hypothetical protein